MKLNWGLIGCGDISRKRVAPALRDLKSCRFIGVSRAKKELVRSFAQEFGSVQQYFPRSMPLSTSIPESKSPGPGSLIKKRPAAEP